MPSYIKNGRIIVMKLNVGVFFGGVSCEHEISCLTANQVINALDQNKYNVIPIYVSKTSDLYSGEALLNLSNYSDLDNLCNSTDKVALFKDGNKVFIKPINGLFKKVQSIDVAFLSMHGTNGEDGAIQGMMEMLRLPYTSSDILGSAIGQDKAIMKQIFKSENIPMVDYFYFYCHDYEQNKTEYKKQAKKIGYPLICKPANLGSSVGIEIIHNEKEFESKVKEAAKYDFKLVIESMITNLKEVNISVMGSILEAKYSAIEEVIKNDELLSYKDKYLGGSKSSKTKVPTKTPTKGSKGMASTSRIVPARITAKQQKQIEELSLKVFKVLNASGCVRIDFMIDDDNGKVYVNEINSIPGSLAFYLWKEVGTDFSKECDVLINEALKRYKNKEKKTYSFETNILKNYRRK